MIKFSLLCGNGHGFDSWFSTNAAFANQSDQGLVACPICASTSVEKALMAPNISTGSKRKGSSRPATAVDDGKEETVALARQLVGHIKKTTEYVGDRFADEARKIHFDEVPARPIWGSATREETSDLKEDGIGVVRLPPLPEEQN